MKRDQAILLLVSGLMAGCKSPSGFGINETRQEKTRNAILREVASPERQNKLLAVVNAFQQECQSIGDRTVSLRTQISEANRNYGTSRTELESLYSNLGELTVQFGETVKTRSLEFRALCSQDEWEQIASHKTEAVHFTF